MATAPGESFYGEAIAKTLPTCWSDNEDDRVFRAVLVAEPNNQFDPNAVGVWSSLGKLGHLLWDEAVLYRQLFDEIRRRGYDGGFCEAVMRGGTPDKPNIGTGFEVGLALFMAFLTIGTCRVDRRRPQPTLPLGERRLDQLASLLGRLQVEAAAGA